MKVTAVRRWVRLPSIQSQFSENPFRIFRQWQKNNLRRSDDGFATHESEDASVEAEHTTSRYHYSEDANEVTTDSDDDYFMHDTESVDRLADDGETRGPFKSSTLAIDKNYY